MNKQTKNQKLFFRKSFFCPNLKLIINYGKLILRSLNKVTLLRTCLIVGTFNVQLKSTTKA